MRGDDKGREPISCHTAPKGAQAGAHPLPALPKGTTVLVTGAAGFIGSHLSELLLRNDCNVVAVDDLRRGRRSNLPSATQHLRFEHATVGDPEARGRLEAHIGQCQLVFHLASPVGVAVAHTEPMDTVTSIVAAGTQMAELCKRYRCPLLFTSSSEVYGVTRAHPTSEDAPLVLSAAARLSYAAAKLAVEHLVAALYRQFGVPSWIVRLFNVAGPRQRADAGVIASFTEAACANRPLLIHGDGTQTRCFLHVADAAEALLAVATSPPLHGRVVNVGATESTSINELVRLIQEKSESRGDVLNMDYRQAYGDGFVPIQTRIPDTRLLRESTTWQPRYSLDDIIRDCIAQHSTSQRSLA